MDKHEFMTSSGLQVHTLELWIEQRWLIPQESSDGIRFTEIDMARVRLIQDLRNDIGANDEGIDVILHLMDQLHGLRRALSELRENMQERSA